MIPAPFVVRLAVAADAASMVALHHRAVHAVVHPAYPAAILDAWAPAPVRERIDWMLERIADPDNVVRVATVADALAGFVFATPAASWLRALYVDPAHAGRGAGAALLGAAEACLRAAGCARIGLNASLNAVAFYRAQGYRVGETTTQQLGDGTRMACVALDKTLG
jgi:GNAT superfamily N-acetyltransferase